MKPRDLRDILSALNAGRMTVDDVICEIESSLYEDIGFAKVDHHRPIRTGYPEVIFGPGKTSEQVVGIVESMLDRSHPVLVTKTTFETFKCVQEVSGDAEFNELAGAIIIRSDLETISRPGISVVSAGTADLNIAEEAAITAEVMGNEVVRINDVGVAGIHRLFDALPILRDSNVIIVVAGMEAAIASVLAGLVSMPIVAVPTSVGYGSNFEGLSALLGMLNSCAPGVATVNIDNGFGAGYLAAQINQGLIVKSE
ncbi:MAG: nickel pincer cofactor biosynthesis protein LarB [Dehalococcoidia bacterium]|nr:nickel pincer cofactor biosynthesis protein LarB [Dehalococcoidia bacterium]